MIKIVIGLLIPLGVFARFFFGVSTFNQIFIGLFLGLAVSGVFFFDDWWNNQFKAIFNSNSSNFWSRWLALLFGIGGILDIVAIYFIGRYQIKHAEKGTWHPFAKSSCKSVCFHPAGMGKQYLSNESFVEAAWWFWVPVLFLYFAFTSSVKYSNNKLNLIKYAAQFKSTGKMAAKLGLYFLCCAVLIVSHFVNLKSWKDNAGLKFGLSLLFVIMYRWFLPGIKKKADIFIGSDMFAPWMNDDDEEKKSLI